MCIVQQFAAFEQERNCETVAEKKVKVIHQMSYWFAAIQASFRNERELARYS